MNELNGQDWENLFPIRPNLGVSADIGPISEISGVFFFFVFRLSHLGPGI